MIVYKVIEKNTRWGTNWTIYKNTVCAKSRCVTAKDHQARKEKLKTRNKFKEYFPRYLKGVIVKAAKGSPGIMTFSSLEHAMSFRDMYDPYFRRITKVIKVNGLGNPNRNVLIKRTCGTFPERLKGYYDSISAPEGTIGFPSVKVLE